MTETYKYFRKICTKQRGFAEMRNRDVLNSLSKEQLIELLEIYSKNWLALDGVWFQSVEDKFGMDEAMFHDKRAWERFTVIEARRIRDFLKLGENAGLEGLSKALELRFYGCLNDCEIKLGEDVLYFANVDCRVQTARRRKGMELHPCKEVSVIEYTEFAKAIDPRINCRCVSCYPDVTDDRVCCSWEFYIQ